MRCHDRRMCFQKQCVCVCIWLCWCIIFTSFRLTRTSLCLSPFLFFLSLSLSLSVCLLPGALLFLYCSQNGWFLANNFMTDFFGITIDTVFHSIISMFIFLLTTILMLSLEISTANHKRSIITGHVNRKMNVAQIADAITNSRRVD